MQWWFTTKHAQLNKEIKKKKRGLESDDICWLSEVRTVQPEVEGLWASIWLPCCSGYHNIEPYWRSYQLSAHKNSKMLEWEHMACLIPLYRYLQTAPCTYHDSCNANTHKSNDEEFLIEKIRYGVFAVLEKNKNQLFIFFIQHCLL